MNISNAITEMIIEMLEEKNEIEFQRNILAQRLGCVPSQINYVLSSRFTPESGFLVESRRGGGGCIKITRLSYNKDSLLSEVFSCVGEKIDEATAKNHLVNLVYHGVLDKHDAAMILSAVSDNVLKTIPPEYRARTRAAIFKALLIESNR